MSTPKRYDMTYSHAQGPNMEESPDGEYVRWEDYCETVRRLTEGEPVAVPGARHIEPFVVKHYAADERPTIKGNGFDGLEIGVDREDAEDFVKWLNERLGVRTTGEL